MRITNKLLARPYLIILALVVTGVVGLSVSSPVSALSGSEFNAGRIIDDAVFFNSGTMSPQDIQSFLNSKTPSCDTNGSQPYGGTTRASYGASRGYPPSYVCLKDYSQAIPSKSADAYCGGSIGGGTKSSAQIIYEVGIACGVSPKVLIVLLQKEQSLVTDDWPWSTQYQSATGYGCPDTAPCDAEYYGFFNQVYNAARQFQRYVKQPQLFSFVAGQTSNIQYNPNAACGSSPVAIQNGATAALYNYTPYQPNASALANLYGSGDSCGAYGNRNFWRMYNDWFGSTHSNTPFAWSFEGQQSFYDAERTQPFSSVPTIAPGDTMYVRVKARNMGTQTWLQNVRMGTSRANDRVSQFYNSTDWISPSRPARILEGSVSPGAIGTFEFTLKAPSTTGSYKEYFNVLVENATWLNDIGLYFTFNVVAPVSSVNNSTNLVSGSSMQTGQFILSPDKQSVFILQTDGNLVLYSNFKAVWNSNTAGRTVNRLEMQADGNLVLYGTGDHSQPVWNSGTSGNAGAQLELQTDGNLVLYSSGRSPLWATYSSHLPNHLAYVNTSLGSAKLYPGQQLETADRRFRLVLQTDGNLVIYSPSRATWSSGTWGKQVAFLSMQGDGNLVLYGTNGQPLWNTHTNGNGASRLLMQQDGNLVIYNSAGSYTWHSHTAGQQ